MANADGQTAGCGSQRTTLLRTQSFQTIVRAILALTQFWIIARIIPTIMNLPHQPVLYKEIIHALQPRHGGRYVDGTVGAGGHARGILEACAPDGQLLGLDVDPQALALARETLAPYEQRIHLAQASYTTLSAQLKNLRWDS